jgi:hypothetical protein
VFSVHVVANIFETRCGLDACRAWQASAGSPNGVRVNGGAKTIVPRFLLVLVLLLLPAGGVGYWVYTQVYSEPDVSYLYEGACNAYGSDSPSCRECQKRGLPNCDRDPNAKTAASTISLPDVDCESRAVEEKSIEELRGMVDKVTSDYSKLASAFSGGKQDSDMLEGFAKGKVPRATACPYFARRIKELQTVDFEQTVATLDKLSQCLSRLSAVALKRSRDRYVHNAVHMLARSIIDIQIAAEKTLAEIAERARHSQAALKDFERDINLCKS